MAVTIREVASAAGVSVSTVSRAFTAPDQVQPKTRQRILDAAARLGYSANPAARSLRGGGTGTLGLIVPDIANPFFPPIIKAMQARARHLGYTVLVADSDEREADELAAIAAVSKRVDGLILWASTLTEDRLHELAARMPLVVVNRHVPGIPEVRISLSAGIAQAAEQLKAYGHRRCVFINASRPELSRGKSIQESFEALDLSLSELGPYEPRFETGVHAATLVAAHEATAVIAHNDLVALGVLHQMANLGMSVPRDVSVIGIDDTLLASVSTPGLTTIRIDPEEIATRAGDLLIETIARQPDRAGGGLEPDSPSWRSAPASSPAPRRAPHPPTDPRRAPPQRTQHRTAPTPALLGAVMPRNSRRAAILGCMALTATLAGCSSLTPSSAGGDGDLVLRVQGMPPATDKPGLALFKQQVADFEKANPGIRIKGSTTVFDPLTFSAKLAGGNVEDVIRVPLTEPQRLIQQKQVQPITGQLKEWEHFKEFNPQVLQPLTDGAGDVYGVPQNPYAQGLVYNRELFEKAGLDPDSPPVTWADVRTAAKRISDSTGTAGFVHESKDNQGGWQLTMLSYAFGGELQKEQGGTYTATLTGEPTKKALRLLKDMRWKDDSLGRNLLTNQNDVIKQFAAGQVGMFMGSPGTYRLAKMQFGMENTDAFGVAPMPQSGGDATLTGGDIYMVPKSADKKHAAAAVEWLTFAYAKPQYSTDIAAEQAKALSGDPKSAVGVPTLPVFDSKRQTEIDAAIKPYVNVKLRNFKPYTDGLATLKLKPEPPYQAQKLYAALDPVVQAVLTKRDADIDALLASAEKDVNAKLAADQK